MKKIDNASNALDTPSMIFISGKKKHGKTTLARMLKESLSYQSDGLISVDIMSYSDPIKIIGSSLFSLNHSQLYGNEKEVPIEFWNNMTPREIMQDVGSKLRDIDKDIFVKAFIKKVNSIKKPLRDLFAYTSNSKIIINDDCRYLNEVSMTKENCEKTFYIRIERPGVAPSPYDKHSSETELDEYDQWDYRILNDGDLEDLRNKAMELISRWK